MSVSPFQSSIRRTLTDHVRRIRILERLVASVTPTENDWTYVGTAVDDPRITGLTTADSPSWENGWVPEPGADGRAVPTRFRLSPDNDLEIEGSFTGGLSGTVAFTLPVAWRRDYRKVLVISDDDHNVLVCVVDDASSATPGVVVPWEALTVGATGAVGSSGATWRTGSGAPSSGLGSNGDLYLNTANGDVYLKSGGTYSVVENITGPAGATGATGASSAWHDGTGAPSGGLGANGDYYLNDANGDVYFKSGGSWSVVANIKGATGSTGSTGSTGATGSPGIDAGLRYVYSILTTNTDPGSGHLKFDSATLSAISSLRISETDDDGSVIPAVIQSWDDSTSNVRSTITIIKEGAPTNILVFQIVGAIVDNGAWDSFTITYVGSSGSFSDGDVVRLFATRTGDKGDVGPAGATGATGSTGTISPEDENAIVAMEVFA